jgi:hypothetical protein
MRPRWPRVTCRTRGRTSSTAVWPTEGVGVIHDEFGVRQPIGQTPGIAGIGGEGYGRHACPMGVDESATGVGAADRLGMSNVITKEPAKASKQAAPARRQR